MADVDLVWIKKVNVLETLLVNAVLAGAILGLLNIVAGNSWALGGGRTY